jgi:TnpA family transposase
LLETAGGTDQLRADINMVSAFHGHDPVPLMWRFYSPYRSALFRALTVLRFAATTADAVFVDALALLAECEQRRGSTLAAIDMSFASQAWQQIVLVGHGEEPVMDRRQFEVCVFACLAGELRSGDIAVEGSEEYADWRDQLLSWEECEPDVAGYCSHLGLPADTDAFVDSLRNLLSSTATAVDDTMPANDSVVIDNDGLPVLRRPPTLERSATVDALQTAVLDRVEDFGVLDTIAACVTWCDWDRHFGPLSGSDPKLDDPRTRYLATVFAYGTNLGPAQAARHMPGITAHMLSFVNRRHISIAALDAANRDLINLFASCALPRLWGDPALAAADGTKYDLSRDTLIAEYHIRYGGWGGIAYRHVSDTYIALFTRFVPCGVSEAVYVLDGLLANTSDLQPDTIHTDSHGQTIPAFGLAHLLGINLMPRIKNWKDLRLYRPDAHARYQHIDQLFSDTINWDRIRTHHHDLLQVVLSIRAGRITSPVLLRRLGSYSHRNRLYQAFQELGRVIRTVFLLRWLSDIDLRHQVTTTTNKVEQFHNFAKWLFFGGEARTIATGDPDELEKRIKYNDLTANAVAVYNVLGITHALRDLDAAGHTPATGTISRLSPFLTSPVKRFGDYTLPNNPAITFDADHLYPPNRA